MFTSKLKLVTRMRLSRSPRRSFRIKNGRVGGVAGSECKNDEDGNVVVQLDKFTLVGLPVAANAPDQRADHRCYNQLWRLTPRRNDVQKDHIPPGLAHVTSINFQRDCLHGILISKAKLGRHLYSQLYIMISD